MFDICESKLPDPVHGFVNPNPIMESTFQIPTITTKQPFFSSTTSSPMNLNLSNDIQSDMKNEDSPKSKEKTKNIIIGLKIEFVNGKL